MWICCEYDFKVCSYYMTHHAFISLHCFVASRCIAFFLLLLYVMFEYALCMCLLVLLSSLSLSGIIPPLPQVLQGTTMQQLQQVQVAQSQATPITVNTSNPSKWLLFFPQKSFFGVQRSFFRAFCHDN